MKNYKSYMLRPVIYLCAYRLMVALIFFLAVHRFVPNGPQPDMIAGFLAALFALFTYLLYLRMDGLRIPRMKYIRPKEKKDPLRFAPGMSDHTDDEPPVTFDELEPEERDLCSFLSNIPSLIIFLVLSFVL